MTYIQWLYRAWNLETEIRQMEEMYTREYAKATKGVTDLTGASVSGTKDPHMKMDRIAALSDQINSLKCHRLSIVMEVIEVIEDVPKQNLRMVLRLRFISSMQWKQIANELNYSDKHIKRLYKKALETVRPIIEARMNAPERTDV